MQRKSSAKETAARFAELFPAAYKYLHARPDGEPRLTPESTAVLMHLAHAGPLSITEAARHFQRAQSVVSELVAGLERRGLLVRMRDERDRRRTLFWLTAVGSDALARRHRVLDPTRLEQAVEVLRPAQRAALVEGMTALIAAAERVSQRMTRRKP